MSFALLILLFSVNIWPRPVVLLGVFDPFGRASFNNSEKMAEILLKQTKKNPHFELRVCHLRTAFDKSFHQLEDCVRKLSAPPKLVLGLGESNCNLKIETIARNLDKTKGPDNDGVEKNYTRINPHGPKEIGFTYPLAQMYCSLGVNERSNLEISNFAGTFVCNNLAYQFSENYEDLSFGFIHVPLHTCKNLDIKNQKAAQNLETMILAAVKGQVAPRLLTKKKELDVIRSRVANDRCLKEFYGRTKGVDEKNLWPF